jgi:MerR family transcriptional regulator, light-induced transcriptional regulator
VAAAREPDLSLQEAADALGVHYQTAYAWVRSGALAARKAGRGYQVSAAGVRALRASRAAGLPPRPEIRVRDWTAQADRLYAAITDGQETAARRELDRLARGVSTLDLCQLVIGPALRRLGEDWAAGTVTIAAEHRASAICDRLIGARAAQQPRGRPRGIAVVATPPGERHALPSLMAAACLREDRWLVHHLAADLPVAEVDRFATRAGAQLVVLSSATSDGSAAAVAAAAELAAAAPGRVVLAGGPGDSLQELIELARTKTARPVTPASR